MIHFKQRDAGAWHQAILYITFIKMYQMLTKFIVKQKTHHQAVTLFFTSYFRGCSLRQKCPVIYVCIKTSQWIPQLCIINTAIQSKTFDNSIVYWILNIAQIKNKKYPWTSTKSLLLYLPLLLFVPIISTIANFDVNILFEPSCTRI